MGFLNLETLKIQNNILISFVFQAVSGLPDPSGEKEGRSETDSQMSGSEDQKSAFDKDLNKVSKSSHSISKQKKSSKKARNR